MRIFFLVDVFPAVSETFILSQITGLMDRGHDVRIFAAARLIPETSLPPDVAPYRLMGRVTYLDDRPQSFWQRLRGLPRLLTSAGNQKRAVLWRSLNILRYGREALSLNLAYLVYVFLRYDPPDIWQCHFGPNGLAGVLLKGLGLKGRVVTMFHGYDIRMGLKDCGRRYAALASSGDMALSICEYNRARLLEWGFPQDKIENLPVGINTAFFHPRPPDVEKKGTLRIVTVARLVHVKNVSLALETLAQLKNRKVVLDIIGDGPLRGMLEEKVRTLMLGERVVFHGACSPLQVAAVLAAGDVFFLTSRAEALPVSIMEAMACGLPVVASDVGGIRELVADWRSGTLFPAGDVAAACRALEEILADEERRCEWGREGRRIVERSFDNKILIGRLENIYQRLCQ